MQSADAMAWRDSCEAPLSTSSIDNSESLVVSEVHPLFDGQVANSDLAKCQTGMSNTSHNVIVATPSEDSASTTEEKQACQPSHSRLSVVSFLIALIGGGVFSLEAFEAFPML